MDESQETHIIDSDLHHLLANGQMERVPCAVTKWSQCGDRITNLETARFVDHGNEYLKRLLYERTNPPLCPFRSVPSFRTSGGEALEHDH